MVMESPQDYNGIVTQLMEYIPDILAVAIIEDDQIVFSTDNWDIRDDVDGIASGWKFLKAPFFIVSGIKYTTLQLENDSLVATSVKGKGHIVGFKDNSLKIITYVSPEGDRKAAIVELQRIVQSLSSKKPYISEEIVLTPKYGSLNNKLGEIDVDLRQDITEFLNWINDENGLPGFIKYYLDQNDGKVISELSKIYVKFLDIFEV